MTAKIWIALAIGNSRYHWAWFLNTRLQASWDTSYLPIESIGNGDFGDLFPTNLHLAITERQLGIAQIPIYLCSVVPSQTVIWQQLPQVNQITLADIPLFDLYPTFGIDRALAILGAGANYGYPALVIDAGTALTITGVSADRRLVGGAIMPGLKLQMHSLFVGTAALPEIHLPARLPLRWSRNTEEAIASGILNTLGSGISDFIYDWERLFPGGKIVFTGGDGEILASYLCSTLPGYLTERLKFDRALIFHGYSAILN